MACLRDSWRTSLPASRPHRNPSRVLRPESVSGVVLPSGMTSPELVEAARALRPRLKVLFTTTGYARDALVHHGRLEAGVDLITKPFSYADLAGKERDVLDGA